MLYQPEITASAPLPRLLTLVLTVLLAKAEYSYKGKNSGNLSFEKDDILLMRRKPRGKPGKEWVYTRVPARAYLNSFGPVVYHWIIHPRITEYH